MKRQKSITLIMLVLFSTAIVWAAESTPSEASVLTKLFTEGAASVTYTAQFSSAVPVSTMEQIIGQITGQLGKFSHVKGEKNPYAVTFTQGSATTYISIDSQGRIAGLQITEITPSGVSLADAVAQIVNLDATTSILIRKNGEQIVAHQVDTPLAVGSAFKLAILAALDDAVKEGKLAWSQVVPLDPAYKSLPTGILQTWPDGSLITIETLATLMISISDNTATDALIAIVGRDNIQRYIPNTDPLVTTAEAFRLKNPDNHALLLQYRNIRQADKLTLLSSLKNRELPDASLFTGNPVAPDIEWYMSTYELANLMERVQSLDLMTINPGLATADRYTRVAYKGGSEPGVLHLSTFLIDKKGDRFTVSVTVNNFDAALAENEIMSMYQMVLNTLE